MHKGVYDGAAEWLEKLLEDARNGVPGAFERLAEQIYPSLRSIAVRTMGRDEQRADVSPTDLVNEAYVRIYKHPDIAWTDKRHLYRAFAQAMLHDYINRAKARAVREKSKPLVAVTDEDRGVQEDIDRLEFFQREVERMARNNEQLADIIRLMWTGLKPDQIQEILGISSSKYYRDAKIAVEWMKAKFERGAP